MAISSYGIYLMYKDPSTQGSTYSKLIDIKDFPDLGGAPEMLETTTLSDSMQTYIAGIQSADAMEFTVNYDKTQFTAIKALEGKTLDFGIYFGATTSGGVTTPDGSKGKWEFSGELSVYVSGASVNEVIEATISIAPSTEITFS